MGKLPLERPKDAPVREPIPYPKKKRGAKKPKTSASVKLPSTRIVLGFTADQSDWLRRTAWSLGAMPYSSLLPYLLLDWCGINSLTARDNEDAA